MLKKLLVSTALATLLATTACESDIAARGNIPKPERLAEVKPGLTRDQVLQAIGSPTAIGTFNDKVWYYLGQRTEDYAFYQTTVLDRQIVAVTFDDSGTVIDVKELTKEDSQPVQMVDRATPSVGRDVNIWNQLFSNLGKGAAIPGVSTGGGADSGL